MAFINSSQIPRVAVLVLLLCGILCGSALAQSHKGVFYDNDFSYLEGPDGVDTYLGDALKRRSVGPLVTVDAGGEYRMRHQSGQTANPNRTNDNLLHRTRLYFNAEVGTWFRAYVEGIDAVSDFDDVPPLPIDENRFDALNLFGDVRLWDGTRGTGWFRIGRQELLYGSQRLLSPLDWSNTRRTFDGLTAMWKGDEWDVGAWWSRPVPFGQHVAGGVTDRNFDSPDQSQEFAGIWATWKRYANHKFDFYFLRFNEYDGNVDTFDYNTFGFRWDGKRGWLLWEIEAGYQFGNLNVVENPSLIHDAGFYTVGLGRKLDLPFDPVVWFYFDWASGDHDPADGINGTFNQLFPLGHKYFGFMDFVGRQNIKDWNVRLTATPHEKVKLLLWYHVFHLESATDALYNAAGVPIRVDPTGAAGNDVGQELDLTATFLLRPRCDLLLGYSHLFSGPFIRKSGGVTGEDFYYGQVRVRF